MKIGKEIHINLIISCERLVRVSLLWACPHVRLGGGGDKPTQKRKGNTWSELKFRISVTCYGSWYKVSVPICKMRMHPSSICSLYHKMTKWSNNVTRRTQLTTWEDSVAHCPSESVQALWRVHILYHRQCWIKLVYKTVFIGLKALVKIR